MKKKFFLPALAIVAVAGVCTFSAFSSSAKSSFSDQVWTYNGGDTDNPASYSLRNENDAPCDGQNDLCAIIAPGTAQPVISSELAERIENKDAEVVFLKN